MRLMRLNCRDEVPHLDISLRANNDLIKILQVHGHIPYLGHVHRISESRISRQALYCELVVGERKIGGNANSIYKDHISRACMKKGSLTPSNKKSIAVDLVGCTTSNNLPLSFEEICAHVYTCNS